MDDRTLKELIYLVRSNDPVALQYLYSYYDALVKAVMRKMKYISSMSLEPQDLLQVGLITFDKVFWSYRDDLDLHLIIYAKSCIIKDAIITQENNILSLARYEKKSVPVMDLT